MGTPAPRSCSRVATEGKFIANKKRKCGMLSHKVLAVASPAGRNPPPARRLWFPTAGHGNNFVWSHAKYEAP